MATDSEYGAFMEKFILRPSPPLSSPSELPLNGLTFAVKDMWVLPIQLSSLSRLSPYLTIWTFLYFGTKQLYLSSLCISKHFFRKKFLDVIFLSRFDVDGYVTGFGNPDWARTHLAATSTAPTVSALLRGGAICLGKTVMDEMAYRLEM